MRKNIKAIYVVLVCATVLLSFSGNITVDLIEKQPIDWQEDALIAIASGLFYILLTLSFSR